MLGLWRIMGRRNILGVIPELRALQQNLVQYEIAAAMERQKRDLLIATWRDILHEAMKDRKSTRLNSSHTVISYAVFCLKKKKKKYYEHTGTLISTLC